MSVALQYVRTAIAFLEVYRSIRIIFRHSGLHHFLESDAHTFGDSRRRTENFTNECHAVLLV